MRRILGKLVSAFGSKADPPQEELQQPHSLLVEIEEAFPEGPTRRATYQGVARIHDLTGKAPVIDEILIFDGSDHWLYLFLGCGDLGYPFELSFRCAKPAGGGDPPDWPIEPVTRVADAIVDGSECGHGVTWVLGSGLGGALSAYSGFITLRDIEFGSASPIGLYQLVPVTSAELELKGEDKKAFVERLLDDKTRLIGAGSESGLIR